MTRIFLTLPILLLTLSIFQAPAIHGATALETVIAECRTRTGFGESTCKTLVKKYMTVERCQEYTSFSKEECAKKIEEIKKDPEFEGKLTPAPPPSVPKVSPTVPAPTAPSPGVQGTGRLQGAELIRAIRAKKEADLLLLWERTKKMSEYLKSSGKDTASIEARFPVFEQKAEAILAAYDTYLATFEKTVKENETLRRDIRSKSRAGVEDAITDLSRYYRSDILGPLRSLGSQSL